MASGPSQQFRIGALAKRVGVSETLLRAWELRYGLLNPVRTTGGYRMYGPEDERRARAMQAARADGVPAAQAASRILATDRAQAEAPRTDCEAPPSVDAATLRAELETAMTAFDTGSMHDTIDRAFAALSVESAIREVLLPFLAGVGVGWQLGDFDVADEHFASDVVRGRLAALAAGPGSRTGPVVLLACPPKESHDIALKAFEVVLQRAGWRTRFLGPHTPLTSIEVACEVVRPDVVVLAGTARTVFELPDHAVEVVRRISASSRLLLAGAGADDALADSWGGELLQGDPISAAQVLVQRSPRRTEREAANAG
ncbi:MerR family transcriptional regulator [Nocardioides bruguierae]|uniref:MerR family transcriptional regulator n=1 Tax=Nocardioides bruguierae TaxID=2945102 RepID=UPI002020954E|nr:MerR family transcriptional regulator [Nocardioides bruguierae]MCL8026142.1 cobalamin B12-binding domain-containing protein [Nocardioides bruguierae]